jgi:hypothetical protein
MTLLPDCAFSYSDADRIRRKLKDAEKLKNHGC